MYAINEDVAFTLNIEPMPTDPIPVDVSLALIDPNGQNTYDLNGATIGAVYVPPTAELPGSYSFTTQFDVAGNWGIILGDGVASDYKVLSNTQIYIEQSEPNFITSFNWNEI